MIRHLLCFAVLVNFHHVKSEEPIVETVEGRVRGRTVHNSFVNVTYYAFQGIPFAQPPLGKLRFQPPQKHEPWEEVQNTTQDGIQCFQQTGGSEDCLFLNVFTTHLPDKNSTRMPVIFFVFGGGFARQFANTSNYGPDYLIKKGVVYVNFNYRLGVFGYLNAMNSLLPGNAGLWDMVEALKWVQRNIAKFNGDPDNVTIYGGSSGAISVNFLMQTKWTRGLFHRVISVSGSFLANGSVQPKPKEKFRKLVRKLGIKSRNMTEIVEKLQSIDAAVLYQASFNWTGHIYKDETFLPSLEYKHSNAFMSQPSIKDVLQKDDKQFQFLTGHTNGEVASFTLPNIRDLDDIEMYKKNPALLVSPYLYLKDAKYIKKFVEKQILKYYFNDEPIGNETTLLNFNQDDRYIRGVRFLAEILKKNHDVYLYKFTYEGNKTTPYPGVAHGEDLLYIYYSRFNQTKEDAVVTERMVTFFTNFAKTGNPTPKMDPSLNNIIWPKLGASTADTMLITDDLAVVKYPDQGMFEFWKNIFIKYSIYGSSFKSKIM